LLRRKAKDMFFEQLDGLLEIVDASSLGTIVGRRYKVFYGGFVLLEEGMDMILVYDSGALCLWCDQVEEEACSDPGIERNPIEDTMR
jgi:hypothetical protein